jgi:nicotinate-nucleotide pyrophosphorylase (carboxylating)
MDHIDQLIELALSEDIGSGDITTDAVFEDRNIRGNARIYAKEDLVLAGVEVTQRVFAKVDPSLNWMAEAKDGQHLSKGDTIAKIEGSVASLLKAERVALNFMQQLAGIATYTFRFVDAVKDSGVILRDTRKTRPGLRALSKAATKAGGAENHPMGLYDQFLIKDNHIDAAGSVRGARVAPSTGKAGGASPSRSRCSLEGQNLIQYCVEKARAHNPKKLKIQVEVRNEKEAAEAVTAGADSLLLDNMTFEMAEQIADKYRDQVELEVSGNVTLVTIARWARTGIHAISVGALTHSAPAMDISMEIRPS